MENTAMEKKYMAFISYSHADNREEGRKWADWLHHSLETYEIPKDLVGKKNSRGETIPEQIYPVFQDEKELSASSSLQGALKDALSNAENLIYLSSPASAKSVYVQDELKYFKQIGKADRIMALIIAGEPEYGETCTDDQCFPDALRYKVDKDGNILKDQKEEPLAADVRIPGTRNEGFTSAEAFRRYLRAEGVPMNDIASRAADYREKLELAKLKIISGVLAVPLGELTKRDKAYQLQKIQEKNRRMKRIATAISALAILAILMGIFAWNQKNKAQRTLAHSLFASGITRTTKGDVANGAAFIAEAIRNGDENARIYGASMLTARTTEYRIPYASGAYTEFSDDGRWLVTVANLGDGKNYLQVWDVENNRPARTLRNIPLRGGWDFKLDKNSMIYFKDENNRIYSWDHINNKVKMLYKPSPNEREPSSFEVSPNGNTMVIEFNNDLSYAFFDTKTMKQLGNDFKKAERTSYPDYVFSDDGKNAVAIEGGGSLSKTPPTFNLIKFLPDGNTQSTIFKADLRVPKATFNKNGNLAAIFGGDQCYLVDFNTMSQPRLLAQGLSASNVHFNPDGKTITIEGFPAKLVDIATGNVLKEIKTLPSLRSFAEKPNTSPLHTHLLKTADRQLLIENQNKGQMLLSQLSMNENLNFVTPGPESKVYFTRPMQKDVLLWDYATDKVNPKFIATAKPVSRLDYMPKAKLLAIQTEGKIWNFYNAKDGKPVGKSVTTKVENKGIFFNNDETEFSNKDAQNEVAVWNIKTGQKTGTLRDDAMDKYMMSPDLQTIFILNKDKSWKYLNFKTKEKIAAGKPGLSSLRFSPDGKVLLMFYENGNADVMELPAFKKLFSLKTIVNPIGDFSNGDKFAVSEDLNHVRIWSLKDQKPIGQSIPVSNQMTYFRFSEDGSKIYIADSDGVLNSNDALTVYDSNTGYPITMPFAPSEITFAKIFSDDSRILTVNRNIGKPVLSVWEIPGRLSIGDGELASDLERYYGRKYDTKTGTVLYVNSKIKDKEKWYFQDEYSRTITPNTQHSIAENIRKYIPVQNTSQLGVLENAYLYHPLAKAAIAHYYSREPETGYLAEYFYDIAKKQVALLQDEKLKSETNKILKLTEENIYAKK